MQTYSVTLESPAATSFRSQMAANSMDIDVSKKLRHELNITADLLTPWNVGLIIGSSGSGKTTLAKKMFGNDCFDFIVDYEKPVIEQFPESWDYEKCQATLNGIGLSQVVCWIRPLKTLSNGQQARAIAALQMGRKGNFVVDEWTSVVDRTVAKAMSLSLGKHARRTESQIVACACHNDIAEWLDPDWIIDCNTQTYIDRRLLCRGKRREQLKFEIKEIDRKSWRYFSKYHYLSEKLPGGLIKLYGLFHNNEKIGFQCFANYTPYKKALGEKIKMHSNRTVIHPDYVGLGLGMRLIEATSFLMRSAGYDVWAKFSSVPVAKAFDRSNNWSLKSVQRFTKGGTSSMQRNTGFRNAVKSYSYHFQGKQIPSGVSLQFEND
jgi:ABC-type Mn2+/Zn2+ transport system ATPase subunit